MIQTIPIKPGDESALGTEHWCARAWRRATQGNTARGTVYLHALRPFRYTLKHNAPVLNCIRRSALARQLLAQPAGFLYQIGLFFLKCFYFLFEPLFVFEQGRNALAQIGVNGNIAKEFNNIHVVPNTENIGPCQPALQPKMDPTTCSAVQQNCHQTG